MTIISFIFGILLNLLGLVSFYLSGASHPHTLFSCLFGLIIIACSFLSRDPKFYRRGMQGIICSACRIGRYCFLPTATSACPSVHMLSRWKPGDHHTF